MTGIVAYSYNTEQFHPHCISEMFTGTDHLDAEPHLNRIAAERGITRYQVDTNVFPVPEFSTDESLYDEDGKPRGCGKCLTPLDENYTPPADAEDE